jgi:hypothetical protein
MALLMGNGTCDVSMFEAKTITVRFVGAQTSFIIDDVALIRAN